jgi:glycosyltransferase involved in cell wall biosynthesis
MSRSILFVHQGYELYGSDRTFIQSVSAAAKRWPDAKLTILLPNDGALKIALQKIVQDVRVLDLAILRKSALRRTRLRDVGGFFAKIREARRMMRGFDLTYINTAVVMDFVLAACLLGRPRILHVHELPTGMGRVFFSTLAMWSGAFVIFNSKATRCSFWLLPWQKSAVVWNGVASGVGMAPRKPHSCVNFLLIGRINSWKGQGVVLGALAALPAAVRDRVHVRFVGGVFGKQTFFTEELTRQIVKMKLQEFLEMCPFVEDPAPHYAWADVVLVPSTKPEPFGLVAIEAMAAGRCVIAAGHGGLVEIVVDGVTGKLVIPGSDASLAEAMTSYVHAPQRAEIEGMAGRKRFEAEFEEEHYKMKVTDTIASLCGAAWA